MIDPMELTDKVCEGGEDGKGDEEADDGCTFPRALGGEGFTEVEAGVMAWTGTPYIVTNWDG